MSKPLWLITVLALFIYSYGFLDFNLTLSSHPWFLSFVAPLQHLVYFERPRSALIYSLVMLIFLVLSIATLVSRNTGKLKKFPWKPIILLTGILSLAYPMLSYDIFNYMFHGKILWFYHMNPHLFAPLDFSPDLWLRFMRWTHTTSAYGPVFTAIESPAYLLGMGKFVPVMYLMKLTMAGFFLWCIYLVGKIGDSLKFSRPQVVGSQLLLALNPFLLFELVVNGHNDAVMIAFMLYSIYLLTQSRLKLSLLSLLASVGVKYMTALTLPLYFVRKSKYLLLLVTLFLLVPVLVSPMRFQPWYLTWSLIPAVLVPHASVRLWVILASLSGLIYYIPYIYSGFWNNSLPFVSLILYLPLLLSGLHYLVCRNKSVKAI